MVLTQNNVLPKGDESSWQNHTRFAVRNATTIKTFIVMAKINMETRNIFAVYAGINLRRMPMRLTNPEGRACVLIRLALSAEKPCSFTMTTNTTQTTNAATRSAAIPFLCRNRLPLRHLPCRSCPGKQISSGCVIQCMLSWRHCRCFIWEKTLSVILLWFCVLSWIFRCPTLLSVTGVRNSRLCFKTSRLNWCQRSISTPTNGTRTKL